MVFILLSAGYRGELTEILHPRNQVRKVVVDRGIWSLAQTNRIGDFSTECSSRGGYLPDTHRLSQIWSLYGLLGNYWWCLRLRLSIADTYPEKLPYSRGKDLLYADPLEEL